MSPNSDQLATRIHRRLTHTERRNRIHSVSGCLQPIHLTGSRTLTDTTTGRTLEHHTGTVYTPCGNRRETVCPACSDRYQGDAFHLIRTGLAGGKTIPTTVADKPRLFVTLTAPSFGPVHTQPNTRGGRRIPCRCGEYHHPDDSRLSTPIEPDTYDYHGAVLWQGHAGELWHRTITAFRRALATAAGIRVRDFPTHARISYAKVAEYQARGMVHFHAVFRLDGPYGPDDPTPIWATTELLEGAIRTAANTARLSKTLTLNGHASEHTFQWGSQLDIRPIRPADADTVEDDGEINDRALAGYIAKYATKGTSTSEAADRPIRSERHIEHLTIHPHHKTMIRTAWDLGANEGLKFLRRWAHMLGFRGHFLSKSQRYSLTFKTIRGERATFRRVEALADAGYDPDTTTVINHWAHTGSGYDTPHERELAEAIHTAKVLHRKEKTREEHTP